ncbi:MAG: phenylalanine--tRNA ligase subunit beta [Deltaproteobacteria bacterium]|nr:phenylalanine--tRNA ligase subunit beta [Deltaproteobacteria bacterium]
MIVSLNWLKDYVSIDAEEADPDRLAHMLTMAGLEVEAMTRRYDYLSTVVVGRVTAVAPHPDADRLRITTVDCGDRELRVVCGAPNLSSGMKAPLALCGTMLPSGIKVKKSSIRGVESEGMLCSEAELGLGPDGSGLMAMSPDTRPGVPVSEALGIEDTIFDIGLTPNRPDCLSLMGIAREIAAALDAPLQYPPSDLPAGSGDIDDYTSVTINAPDLCPRYTALLLTDIKVGPSPFWLADRLSSVGLKPINNIVDITNYIMMETGQPLHAFDFDRLAENRIIVRTAGEKATFTTLDGKTRELAPETLMICDGEKPVAVAGVIGGENSEIENKTTRVLIESAYFDPTSIRRTAKLLGISTDASYRFERGVDPYGCVRALDRAARLMSEIGGGKIVNKRIDEHPGPVPIRKIRLSVDRANKYIGIDLNREKMISLLESVEFSTALSGGDAIDVTIPSFRVDVSRPEDLTEEIARLWGYDRIETTFPEITTGEAPPDRPMMRLRDRARDILAGFGFYEAISYSFIAENAVEKLRIAEKDPRRNMVKILNPISEDLSVMRTTLIPGLLESMRTNISHAEYNLKLFETGKTFFNTPGEELPIESEMAAGLLSGNRCNAAWHTRPEPVDFFDLKGILESLFSGLGIKNITFIRPDPVECSYTSPIKTAVIHASNNVIGSMGELDANVMKNFDIRQSAFVFELFLDKLMQIVPDEVNFTPIPKFPAVSRDITMIVAQDLAAGEILERVRYLKQELVEDVFLLDVYSGEPIQKDKKSVSIRIIYRSFEKTLKDGEINRLHTTLSGRLVSHFNASLPGE